MDPVGPNSPPISTKGHTRVGFCGGAALGCGSTFGYKEGAPDNSGAVGGGPSQGDSFSWLSVPNTICLVGSLLGPTTIPFFPSYLLVRRIFGHRGSLSISLVSCRIILAAGWY